MHLQRAETPASEHKRNFSAPNLHAILKRNKFEMGHENTSQQK